MEEWRRGGGSVRKKTSESIGVKELKERKETGEQRKGN